MRNIAGPLVLPRKKRMNVIVTAFIEKLKEPPMNEKKRRRIR